jgi:RNA-directed DNA polymerase
MAAEPAEPCATDGASARPMHGALLARILERENLQRALKQVRRNQGAPGIDGMSVDELPEHLKHHWLDIKADILARRYRPQPVRRVAIPKPDGRKRMLVIPIVLDRFVQHAIAQIVQAQWEPHFHPDSYGFRPQRSAHQAVRKLQADVRDGHDVVDIDLESFFDRVNHDRLAHRLHRHVSDAALLRLIGAFVKAGAWVDGQDEPSRMGVPQGGPPSPMPANVVLDEMDWEIHRRGHRFTRYAGPSARDGQVDSATVTLLRMEAMGIEGLPRIATARRIRARSMERQQERAWPVANLEDPGTVVGDANAFL